MARIAGINIPNHQHADIALTAIYGIGRARAQAICAAAGVQGTRKIKDLTDAELDRIRENIQKLTVEGDYSIEEVDALTGSLIGLPNSASFKGRSRYDFRPCLKIWMWPGQFMGLIA